MNKAVNLIGGTFSSYIGLSIPTHMLNVPYEGIFDLAKVLVSGLLALATQYYLMKWQSNKVSKKCDCNENDNEIN
jgi:hypothetical protein